MLLCDLVFQVLLLQKQCPCHTSLGSSVAKWIWGTIQTCYQLLDPFFYQTKKKRLHLSCGADECTEHCLSSLRFIPKSWTSRQPHCVSRFTVHIHTLFSLTALFCHVSASTCTGWGLSFDIRFATSVVKVVPRPGSQCFICTLGWTPLSPVHVCKSEYLNRGLGT